MTATKVLLILLAVAIVGVILMRLTEKCINKYVKRKPLRCDLITLVYVLGPCIILITFVCILELIMPSSL